MCHFCVGGVVERLKLSLFLFYDNWVLQSPAVDFFHLRCIFSIHLPLCVTTAVVEKKHKVVLVAIQRS